MITRVRRIGSLLAAALLAGSLLPLPASAQPDPGLSSEQVPYEMDASNQAGWWHPLAEFNGNTYFAFNVPAAAADNHHEVYVGKRTASGEWTAACVKDASGACAHYVNDIGHNQPSLAIDGDGYLHAFVSMHNDGWRYFRSELPESVDTMLDQAAELPDSDGGVTYPVVATSPRSGDVYLMARVNIPGTGHTGRLYRWSVGDQTWEREAVFTPGHAESGFVPYPDDLEVDARGHVHLLWEWARGSTSNLRYYGSYLVYQPERERFVSISGREVELPVTPGEGERQRAGGRGPEDDGDVVYEPREGVVQSARFALVDNAPELAGIAYRYQPPDGSTFEVRWAAWDGQQWVRETVDAGGFNTFAAIAATHRRATARVYYVKHPPCDPDEAARGTVWMAEKRVTAGSAGGSAEGEGERQRAGGRGPEGEGERQRAGGRGSGWTPRRLGGEAGIERLEAITRRDGTDVLYLAAPNLLNPTQEPALYFATLSRTGSVAADEPGSEALPPPSDGGGFNAETGRKNWAFGASVSVSSALSETATGECAVDGNSWADYSRWLSSGDDPEPWITMALDEPIQVDEVHVHSGYQGGTVQLNPDLAVDLLVDDEWREVGRLTGNDRNPAVLSVDDLTATDQLRLRVLNLENPNHTARIYEVEVYARSDAPPVRISPDADPPFLLFGGNATQVRAELSNRSLEPVSGNVVVDVPQGWTVEPAEAGYELDPGHSTTVEFTVGSPDDASAPEDFDVVVRAPEHGIEAVLSLPVRGGIVYSQDGAPHYTESGPWFASSLSGHDDTTSRYTQGGTGATATWTPDLPHAGRYRVSVWYPTNATTTEAARYTVTHAAGSTELEVNQLAGGNAWELLGEWEFDEGTGGSVALTSVASGHHRANAVRFEPVPATDADQG